MKTSYCSKYDLNLKDVNNVQPAKVLIIDDNQEYLEELTDMLSSYGYEIESISDSERALAVAYQLKPQVILMDLKMSPKSGFQVADDIHHSLQLKDVPVIAMTGFFTEKEHIHMMKICGIHSFILKPLNPLKLINKIECALGRREESDSDDF